VSRPSASGSGGDPLSSRPHTAHAREAGAIRVRLVSRTGRDGAGLLAPFFPDSVACGKILYMAREVFSRVVELPWAKDGIRGSQRRRRRTRRRQHLSRLLVGVVGVFGALSFTAGRMSDLDGALNFAARIGRLIARDTGITEQRALKMTAEVDELNRQIQALKPVPLPPERRRVAPKIRPLEHRSDGGSPGTSDGESPSTRNGGSRGSSGGSGDSGSSGGGDAGDGRAVGGDAGNGARS
jgi:uncharacterized membrane protein YgcG